MAQGSPKAPALSGPYQTFLPVSSKLLGLAGPMSGHWKWSRLAFSNPMSDNILNVFNLFRNKQIDRVWTINGLMSEKMFVINYMYLRFCWSLTGISFKVTGPTSGIFFTFETPAIAPGNDYCGNVIVQRPLPKRNLEAPVNSQFHYRVPIIATHVNNIIRPLKAILLLMMEFFV